MPTSPKIRTDTSPSLHAWQYFMLLLKDLNISCARDFWNQSVYGDIAYKLKKLDGTNNFSAHFIKIISHYILFTKCRGYSFFPGHSTTLFYKCIYGISVRLYIMCAHLIVMNFKIYAWMAMHVNTEYR